jgi:hypothetical protein
MIFFAAANGLWIAGIAGIAGIVGGWALWRGQRRLRSVPSLKLWRGLGPSAAAKGRRWIDPLWALVLLAGLLAAVALAQPQWCSRSQKDRPDLHPDWSVRSTNVSDANGIHAEAWIRLSPAESAGIDAVRVNGIQQSVPAAGLAAGILVPVSATPAELALLSRGNVVATATFEKPADTPRSFGFLRLCAPADGELDPALRRFFEMQPGAQIDDPAAQPVVVLVKGLNLSAEELAGAGLIVAEPDAELPGIKLGAPLSAPPPGWTPEPAAGAFAWPPFVSLKDVHVKALRQAEFSSDWEVIARAGGHPWIAVRRKGNLAIWLASAPTSDTDWVQAGSGFVAFFAEMQNRALGAAGQPSFTVWNQRPAIAAHASTAVPLQDPLGGIAIVLLLVASIWHIKRRAALAPLATSN